MFTQVFLVLVQTGVTVYVDSAWSSVLLAERRLNELNVLTEAFLTIRLPVKVVALRVDSTGETIVPIRVEKQAAEKINREAAYAKAKDC